MNLKQLQDNRSSNLYQNIIEYRPSPSQPNSNNNNNNNNNIIIIITICYVFMLRATLQTFM